MLGKDTEESLENTKKFDELDGGIKKGLYVAELLTYCTDEYKKNYVKSSIESNKQKLP